MDTHELKSWPKFFNQIIAGLRMHELRRNDRNFQIGDRIKLCEFDPDSQAYTGRTFAVEITSITSTKESCAVSKDALHPEFCIMSVKAL